MASQIVPVLKENRLSVYSGELTLRVLLEQNIEIAKAFPALPAGFYGVLNRRLKELKFTDQRLIDAVNYVIDKCQYPTPTVSNFISFDKEVEILTYKDVLKLLVEDRNIFDKVIGVRIDGKNEPCYAYKEDVEKYKLVRW